MPAWQATDFSSARGDRAPTAAPSTGGGGRLRGLLVVGEVATAVLLLFGAGLLLRTLLAVEAFDRGYRADSVLSMLVDPLGSKYPTDESLQQFYDQVEAEVAAVPGVASVAWASTLPLDFFDAGGSLVRDRRRPAARRQPAAEHRLSGRQPDVLLDARSADRGGPRASTSATRATACRSASSTRRSRAASSGPIADRPARGAAAGVVAAGQAGRARDRRRRAAGEGPPRRDRGLRAGLRADGAGLVRRHLPASCGRSPGAAEALAPSVRAAISRVDKEQLVSVRDVMTLEDIAWAATGRHRFRAVMVMAFAALALRAGDGRRVRHPRLFGPAARARLRRAPGARRDDERRAAPRDRRAPLASSPPAPRSGWCCRPCCGRLIETMLFGVQPLDPVDVRGRDDRAGASPPRWRSPGRRGARRGSIRRWRCAASKLRVSAPGGARGSDRYWPRAVPAPRGERGRKGSTSARPAGAVGDRQRMRPCVRPAALRDRPARLTPQESQGAPVARRRTTSA